MFCDQCGNNLVSGQQFCSRCGKEVIGRVLTPYRSRVQDHVRMLAMLWMAYSALTVFGGVILIVVAHTLFGRFSHNGVPPEATMWLRPFLTVIGGLALVKSAAGFFAGLGLLQRLSWGRLLALVVGFLALLNIPLGTALGIYTLWVLLPAQSDRDYEALANSQAA